MSEVLPIFHYPDGIASDLTTRIVESPRRLYAQFNFGFEPIRRELNLSAGFGYLNLRNTLPSFVKDALKLGQTAAYEALDETEDTFTKFMLYDTLAATTNSPSAFRNVAFRRSIRPVIDSNTDTTIYHPEIGIVADAFKSLNVADLIAYSTPEDRALYQNAANIAFRKTITVFDALVQPEIE